VNALLAATEALARAMTRDPLLLLTSAVATFDPLWNVIQDDDDADPLTIALHITRGAFPDIYVEAVERMRTNAPYQEIDRLICKAITAQGIPIDDLETMSWGIPLVSFGVDLQDPEFYAVHSAALPALVPFGIDIPESERYSIDVPECIYAAGGAVAASLHEQDDPALKQVGWLYAWLFGCSGNSLIDLTNEELYEIQPLSWSSDDIAFAVEMIEEADGMMSDAMAGLKRLMASPDLVAILSDNIRFIYETARKGMSEERLISLLKWSLPVLPLPQTP
jgi:hypothetical protein